MTDNRTNEQIVAERLAHVPDECSCHRSTAMDLARDAVDALKGAGRLAGEPTDEQVEAAAQAVREVDARAGLIADVDLPMYRARAALEAAARAAQGAAPQAERATYLNVAHSSVLAGSINARRAAREVSAMQLIDAIYDPDEDDANDSVRYGYVLEQFERLRVIYADLDDPDAGPAPVLPSSAVIRGKTGCTIQIRPDGAKELHAPDCGHAPVMPSVVVDVDKLAEVIAKSRGFGIGWEQIPPLTRAAYREVARDVAEWLHSNPEKSA